jgi:hypothetical protein
MRIEAANALGFSPQRSGAGKNRDGYQGSYRGFSETFSVTLGWWF